MCLYPRLINNRKYTANKKNRGVIPPIVDKRVLKVPTGCQACMECRKQKARDWQVRLMEDVRHNKNGKFITLTFSDESIAELSKEIEGLTGYELDNQIATLAVHRFIERWRKKFKKSVRHWLITELGHEGTENVHMHGIIWTNESRETVNKIWKYGYIWPKEDWEWSSNYVNEQTANYLTKYANKQDFDHRYYKPKILTSAGIGGDYVKRSDSKKNIYKGDKTEETYTTRTGHKIAMPTYWRNKIYSEDEREKLWLQRLDKNQRWVLGRKVDISEGDEEYYKVLEQAQAKNKRLGYGDNSINWERKNYENERRILKQEERIRKGGGLGWDSEKREDRAAGRVRPADVERDSAIRPDENEFMKNI